ncbi:MAG: YraN family protein [Gemmatimonadota bacterium]
MRRRFGAWAETVAARWLRVHGFEILDRNWRYGRRELDIVALDGSTAVFVEVKARCRGPQSPLEAVSSRQRAGLRIAAEAWIHAHPGVGEEFRFDVIGVELSSVNRGRIEHVKDAFTGER